MARMHSRKKGKAGSRKPEQSDLSWVRYKPGEIEMLIAKLAKKGFRGPEIGLQLRDAYGIPDVKELTGKRIAQILQEKKLNKEFPDDLSALIKKFVIIRKHLEKNRQDQGAKRGERLTLSKIKRLGTYYKDEGVLSSEWRFKASEAEMLVE